MSTALDIDIAALVAELEAPPCESAGHQSQPKYHDDGPAAFYGRVNCGECGWNVVKAYCAQFATKIARDPRVECSACAGVAAVTILGPVNA